MPHIHSESGQHDLTASAYIIRLDGAEPRIVLHQHKKLNVFLQFGGHVELDETPWDAVAHEIEEESGYKISQLTLLQPQLRIRSLESAVLHPSPLVLNTHSFSAEHYHTDISWAFVTEQDPAVQVQDGESANIKLFTEQELRTLPADKIFENVREIGLFVFKSCLNEWERVPAA